MDAQNTSSFVQGRDFYGNDSVYKDALSTWEQLLSAALLFLVLETRNVLEPFVERRRQALQLREPRRVR